MLEDIAELVEGRAPKPGPRGPYKKREAKMTDLVPAGIAVALGVVLALSLLTGKTFNPSRQLGPPYLVSRAQEPGRYWLSVVVCALAFATMAIIAYVRNSN